MISREECLTRVAESEGFLSWDELFEARQLDLLDAVVPAICVYCGLVTEMEPDQEQGWCESCDSNTVKSCLILAELI